MEDAFGWAVELVGCWGCNGLAEGAEEVAAVYVPPASRCCRN